MTDKNKELSLYNLHFQQKVEVSTADVKTGKTNKQIVSATANDYLQAINALSKQDKGTKIEITTKSGDKIRHENIGNGVVKETIIGKRHLQTNLIDALFNYDIGFRKQEKTLTIGALPDTTDELLYNEMLDYATFFKTKTGQKVGGYIGERLLAVAIKRFTENPNGEDFTILLKTARLGYRLQKSLATLQINKAERQNYKEFIKLTNLARRIMNSIPRVKELVFENSLSNNIIDDAIKSRFDVIKANIYKGAIGIFGDIVYDSAKEQLENLKNLKARYLFQEQSNFEENVTILHKQATEKNYNNLLEIINSPVSKIEKIKENVLLLTAHKAKDDKTVDRKKVIQQMLDMINKGEDLLFDNTEEIKRALNTHQDFLKQQTKTHESKKRYIRNEIAKKYEKVFAKQELQKEKLVSDTADHKNSQYFQHSSRGKKGFKPYSLLTYPLLLIFEIYKHKKAIIDAYWWSGGMNDKFKTIIKNGVRAIPSLYTNFDNVLNEQTKWLQTTAKYSTDLVNTNFNQMAWFGGHTAFSLQENYERFKSFAKKHNMAQARQDFYAQQMPFYNLYLTDREQNLTENALAVAKPAITAQAIKHTSQTLGAIVNSASQYLKIKKVLI